MMKRKTPQGTAVIYFNTKEEKCKPISIDELQPKQKQCFLLLDKKVQQDILAGKPINVLDLETESTICEFNRENFCPPDWAIEAFARSILPSIQEFYSHEENQKAFNQKQAEEKKKEK